VKRQGDRLGWRLVTDAFRSVMRGSQDAVLYAASIPEMIPKGGLLIARLDAFNVS
jgi:hypothetical protein